MGALPGGASSLQTGLSVLLDRTVLSTSHELLTLSRWKTFLCTEREEDDVKSDVNRAARKLQKMYEKNYTWCTTSIATPKHFQALSHRFFGMEFLSYI